MTDPRLPNLHGSTNPRRAGGNIVGPGGPYDKDAEVIDATNAVILEYNEVVLTEALRGDEAEPVVALLMVGRINKTRETSRILYMLNGDGVAALVTQCLGLIKRAEHMGAGALAEEMRRRLGERWDEMPK